MPKTEIFPASRLRHFAALVSSELGVRVRLRGKSIHVVYEKPPVIFLPNMDCARESDLLPIYGFALHEAAHIRYTDKKVSASAPNYLVKLLHNAIEDEYIERMLERDFPGARESLTRAYLEGIKAVFGDEPMVEETSFLGAVARDGVIEEMLNLGMDVSDPAVVENVAKRMEILRVAKLWILEQRRYPLPLHDWPDHPWHQVFEEETHPRARNTRQAYEQSLRIIDRLGITPCLPGDVRPFEVAQAKADEACRWDAAAREARKALSRAKHDRRAEIRERCESSDERKTLNEARQALANAKELAGDAMNRLARIRRRLRPAEKSGARLETCLNRFRKSQADLEKRAAEATVDDQKGLRQESVDLAERIRRMETDLENSRQRVQSLRDADQRITADSVAAETELERATDAEKVAHEEFVRMAAKSRHEIRTKHALTIDPLATDAETKNSAAKNADDDARKATAEIQRRDSESEEQIAPGAVERAVAEIWERFRNQSAEDELSEIVSGDQDECGESNPPVDARATVHVALSPNTRKYCVLDRSFDRIDSVAKTPTAQLKYVQARAEYSGLIQEMTDKFRKIHSPVRNRLHLNAEQGRLDPSKAYRVGMALRGAAMDVAKVWRETTIRKDQKFVVSLLLDCSGSMSSSVGKGSETHFSIAQKSAAALSEVLRGIGIPHEILGHTTQSERVRSMIKAGEIGTEDCGEFSRVMPFQGLVFKAFNENAVPCSVFSDVALQDNLDGEALLWAAQRLGVRPEKTKLLISISDGLPSAQHSNTAELERHLLMACKAIEARERDGLFVFGIGIGEERVRHFYKNAEVLKSVCDLPKVVLGIVERVICNTY